jgi:hypothetical protein
MRVKGELYQIDAPAKQLGRHVHRQFRAKFVVCAGVVIATEPLLGWARAMSFDNLSLLCAKNDWTLSGPLSDKIVDQDYI